jgi:thiamine biosynthesis lipoprotein
MPQQTATSAPGRLIFQAIGTHWQVDVLESVKNENELLGKILARISVFEKTYSRFLADSTVGKISQSAGDYIFPETSEKLFAEYRKMYDITGGLFTPLIGGVLADAGYNKEYSLKQKTDLTKPPAWDEVIAFDFPTLTVKKPVRLDFGAAGKGYLIDLVGKVLEEEGFRSYCVDAGGDIFYRSQKNEPLKVGLEHPDDTSKVIGTINILNQSLCGSAGNRRAWANFHHIINPETLSSPRDILAVWVLASDTITADILTSGLLFVSPEILKKNYDFEYFILNADYSFQKSDGFQAEIFS